MSKATIQIEGFVSNEPEMRQARDHRIVDITVPVTLSRKVDGQYVEDKTKTIWYQAAFWDEHADAVLASVRKGSPVTLVGGLEVSAWSSGDKSGVNVSLTFPTIAVVVRKPRAGQSAPAMGTSSQDEQWFTPSAEPATDPWPTDEPPW